MEGPERTRRPPVPRAGQARRPQPQVDASVAALEPSLLTTDRVIALQRQYGNQFVLGLLHPPVTSLQRDTGSALDKSSTAAERKELTVLRDGVASLSADELKEAFKGKDKVAVPADDVRFGVEIDAKLHQGLQNVAGNIFSEKGFTFDTVTNLPLDLTPFGGANGVYRFSLILRKTAPKRRLIIEQVSSKPPAQLSKQDLEAERKRFQKFDFRLGTDFEGEEAQKLLYTALARVPDSVLAHVRGLTFSRHLQDAGEKGEPGHYDPNTHTIQLFGGALTKLGNSADAGGADWFTFVVTHEIGHATDFESFTDTRRKRDELAQRLKDAQLEARRADPNAGIGKDADAAQKAKDDKVKQLQTELNAAQAAFDTAVQGLDLAKGGARSQSQAFKDAEGKPLTSYGATANVENFAEDFALFVLDPELLKSLRPQAHAYFSKNFK